jgi:hypothetical protein
MKDETEGMHDLDDELRGALRRGEPPDGFAERVLNRVAEQAQHAQMWGPPLGRPIRPKPDPTVGFIHWAVAAALVAAVAGGFEYVAKQAQRAEGEAARERVMLALHIAGNKLQLVQTKINRLHEQPEKNSNQ